MKIAESAPSPLRKQERRRTSRSSVHHAPKSVRFSPHRGVVNRRDIQARAINVSSAGTPPTVRTALRAEGFGPSERASSGLIAASRHQVPGRFPRAGRRPYPRQQRTRYSAPDRAAGLCLLEGPAADRDRHQQRRHGRTEAAAPPETRGASRQPYWNMACSVSPRSSHCAGMKLKQLRLRSAWRRSRLRPHLPSTSDLVAPGSSAAAPAIPVRASSGRRRVRRSARRTAPP